MLSRFISRVTSAISSFVVVVCAAQSAQAGACIVHPPNSLQYVCDSNLPEGSTCSCAGQPGEGRAVAQFDPFGGRAPQDACAVLPAPKQGPVAAQIEEACVTLAACRKDVGVFAKCSGKQIVLPEMQQELVQCAEISADPTAFAQCAGAMVLEKSITPQQQRAVICATHFDDKVAFAYCLGDVALNGQLSDEQRAVLSCIQTSNGDPDAAASCVGTTLIGGNLSSDQKIAIKCAGQSEADMGAFAACELNAYVHLPLNSEQQIALKCIANSGGEPVGAAACTASALTLRELEKCATDGIGGHGCFGDSNDLVGRDGWTVHTIGNALSDLRNGPGTHNDLFGGQGFAGRTLESIRRNAPPPVNVGKVGGKRVCIPWC